MPQYLVMRSQNAEGCDYSIGCGMRYDVMEAESIEALMEDIVFP